MSFDNFDWEQYVANYSDLQAEGINTKKNAWTHWINYGQKENRTDKILNKIPDNFDWEQYVANYLDLQAESINTKEAAWAHWIKHGQEEGRYNGCCDETYFKNFKFIDFNNNSFSLNNLTTCDNTYYNCIDEDKILITKHYNKLNFLPELIDPEYVNNIKEFILIIDFPNCGGGTTQFINHIVSYYKTHKIFIIARNYSGQIVFTINDEYEINYKYTDDDAICFLDKYTNQIEKIFVNHTLGHSISFLNKLFILNKQVTLITHDFYSMCDIPNPFIHQLTTTYSSDNKIPIDKYDQIITQNKQNLLVYNNYITNKNISTIICELPDYKEPDQLINTDNEYFVIGILGAISDIKGHYILKNIINFYKNKNIKIIIIGVSNISNYEFQYKYHNIKELNELLIKYKPNCLLELSIWSETYSYTLSLAIITQLPILYFKKTGYFVVENRLKNYEKAYGFETIGELDTLVDKHKQDWFYTIKPIIYYNEYWDKYFKQINKNIITPKNIIIITSKIVVSNNIFNYCKIRSIYSVDERFNQTIDTINTIKKYIPDNFIILIDNSQLTNNQLLQIKLNVDIFINPIDNVKLNYYTDKCIYKSHGEIYQTKLILDLLVFLNNIRYFKILNIFKISGRYLVNEMFDYNKYNNNLNIFKKNNDVSDREYIYTCFYKISQDYINQYYNIICNILNEIQSSTKYDGLDLEVFFPKQIKNMMLIEELGITQNVSVWNDHTNI